MTLSDLDLNHLNDTDLAIISISFDSYGHQWLMVNFNYSDGTKSRHQLLYGKTSYRLDYYVSQPSDELIRSLPPWFGLTTSSNEFMSVIYILPIDEFINIITSNYDQRLCSIDGNERDILKIASSNSNSKNEVLKFHKDRLLSWIDNLN